MAPFFKVHNKCKRLPQNVCNSLRKVDDTRYRHLNAKIVVRTICELPLGPGKQGAQSNLMCLQTTAQQKNISQTENNPITDRPLLMAAESENIAAQV